jgi:predicted nucleic acid-binding protein
VARRSHEEPLLMKAYADSSFIVSLYIPEPNRSAAAAAFMHHHREALPFTPQHRLEVRNAIRMLVWSKRISVSERTRAFREVEEDLDDQIFLIHAPLKFTEVFQEAEKIGAAQSELIGCRSLDLFHVAAASELGIDEFLSFDDKQRQLARALGFKVEFNL